MDPRNNQEKNFWTTKDPREELWIHEVPTRKKFSTHKIPTRKNVGPAKYPLENLLTHEISARKNFGPSKQQQRHDATIALDPRDP